MTYSIKIQVVDSDEDLDQMAQWLESLPVREDEEEDVSTEDMKAIGDWLNSLENDDDTVSDDLANWLEKFA